MFVKPVRLSPLTTPQLYSVSERGFVCVWECDTSPEDLVPYTPPSQSEEAEKEESHAAKGKNREKSGTLHTYSTLHLHVHV